MITLEERFEIKAKYTDLIGILQKIGMEKGHNQNNDNLSITLFSELHRSYLERSRIYGSKDVTDTMAKILDNPSLYDMKFSSQLGKIYTIKQFATLYLLTKNREIDNINPDDYLKFISSYENDPNKNVNRYATKAVDFITNKTKQEAREFLKMTHIEITKINFYNKILNYFKFLIYHVKKI